MPEDVLVTEFLHVQTAMARVAADLKAALDNVKEKGDLWLRGKPEKTAVLSGSSSTTSDTPLATSSSEDVQNEVPLPGHVGETSTPPVQHEEL
jgi:hypothetical protein